MKILEVVNAVLAIDELKNVELDTATAYALCVTKTAIMPQYNFFHEEEMKLIKRCAKRDKDGNIVFTDRRFEFASLEASAEYTKKMSEIYDMDVEVNVKRYKIKLPDKIKPVFLEALSSFFDFDIPEIEAENDNSRTES